MDQPRLVLQNSNGNANITPIFSLQNDHTFVGRDTTADFCIKHPFISRKHAEIKKEGTIWTIRDCGSKNGTFVNGSRITEKPVPLNPNDSVAFSPSIEFVFLEAEMIETLLAIPSTGTYGIKLDEKAEDVYVDGILVEPKFSHYEYLFIKKLTEEPDRIHSYDELIRYIYPETDNGEPYVLPIYKDYLTFIKSDISKKIKNIGVARKVIKARTNDGYYLVKP